MARKDTAYKKRTSATINTAVLNIIVLRVESEFNTRLMLGANLIITKWFQGQISHISNL